jgi:3-hydroxybutyrate dehydrogenase
MLKGQSALVTGLTSGIDLGIATALAEAGANVMLNGFGDAAEIERIRASRRRTAWLPRRSSQPTWRPSTACSG